MSSHHIVREKQEPALLILGLDDFDEEYLGQLLEWSPTVIVAASVYEKLYTLGIKIDVIICNEKLDIHLQESIKFIYNAKTQTILQAGINFLCTHAYPAVNIINDTFNLPDINPFTDKLDIVCFVNNKKYYPIKNNFKKWEISQTTIQTFGNIISYYGLQKIAPHTYITVYDGFFGFSFKQNSLFISETL